MAPARNVSAAATATVRFCCFRRCANFARVVVLPVPLIPRKTIRYGSPLAFFSRMRSKTSMVPVPSNMDEMDWIRAVFTNSPTSFLLTEMPVSRSLRSALISSTTSRATSDWRSDISRSDSTSSMSASSRSFSANVFEKPESVLRRLSNMLATWSRLRRLGQLLQPPVSALHLCYYLASASSRVG